MKDSEVFIFLNQKLESVHILPENLRKKALQHQLFAQSTFV